MKTRTPLMTTEWTVYRPFAPPDVKQVDRVVHLTFINSSNLATEIEAEALARAKEGKGKGKT